MAETTTEQLNIQSFLSSLKLSPEVSSPTPMIQSNLETLVEDVSAEERFVSSLAAVVYNMKPGDDKFDKQSIQELVGAIDGIVEAQLNEIIHAPEFQAIESAWTSVSDLIRDTNFRANIDITLFDASKDEMFEDLELNSADIAGSEFFKKVYVSEYDQFGGKPYGKPQGGKPYRGDKPYAGKSPEGKPFEGKPREGKPHEGKPYKGKPSGGKFAKPWSTNKKPPKKKAPR